MRTLVAALVGLLAVSAAGAAGDPFADVPRTHWAYEAVASAARAGVLKGIDGRFQGDKVVTRYQMAQMVQRLLDAAAGSGSALQGSQASDLRKLSVEFSDELAMLNTKVAGLEDGMAALRGDLDGLKMGRGAMVGRRRTEWSGFLSVALVDADDGSNGDPNALRSRTRYAGVEQKFFTLPQSSIAIDHEMKEGTRLFLQLDFGTDFNSAAGAVGVNQVYFSFDEVFDGVGAQLGGFAFPWTNWEYNGRFRTLDDTITPSALSSLFEFYRLLGVEFHRAPGDADRMQWRAAVFTGGELGTAGFGTAFGTILGDLRDDWSLADLAFQNTFDRTPGFYLELESGQDPDRNWGWRLGYFDLGGNPRAPIVFPLAPGAAPPSESVQGVEAGLWWRNDRFKAVAQWMSANSDYGNINPTGGDADADTWYLLLNYRLGHGNSVSVRYDDWVTKNGNPVASKVSGDAFTVAFNRKVSETSMLQFEYLAPDEQATPVVPGTVFNDAKDDQVQLRYKVWF